MNKLLLFSVVLVSACATRPPAPSVERMYVISCGENHVKDVSRWTPGVNVGKPHVFGDHDVFGDGSVTIKSAPGHTLGHQALVVRLPQTGPVMLSGDMVHLAYSWNYGVVPSFNFDVPQSMSTIAAMKDYTAKTGTQLWINHDKEQHAKIPKAPNFVQ